MKELYEMVASLGEELAIKGTSILNEPEKISMLLKIIQEQKNKGRKCDALDTAKFLPEPWRTIILRELFNTPGVNFFPKKLIGIIESQIKKKKYIEARLNTDYLPEPKRVEYLQKIISLQIEDHCFINNIRATARIMLNN